VVMHPSDTLTEGAKVAPMALFIHR
jgi:hypothetical protein